MTQQELVDAKAARATRPTRWLLAIHYHATQNQPRPVLIGFTSELDKEFFEKLITVKDVGPLVAARSLAAPVGEIAAAIARQDEDYLRRLPGIGPQKAKNIVAQLQAKVAKFALARDGRGGPEPRRGRRARTRKRSGRWSSRCWSSSSATARARRPSSSPRRSPPAGLDARPRSCSTRSTVAAELMDGNGGRGDDRLDPVLQEIRRRPVFTFEEGRNGGILFLTVPGVANLYVIPVLQLPQTEIDLVGVGLLAQIGQDTSLRVQRVAGCVQIVFVFQHQVDRGNDSSRS